MNSAKSSDQQVAIVTGVGQGIGFEICCQLAANGASVLFNDINDSLTQNAVKNISENYGSCYGLTGDPSDVAFIEQMVNTAVEKFGKLTIVIANAGITLFGDFLEYTPEAFYQVLHTNLGGSFFLAQAAVRQIKKQGLGGSLLFMLSATGHQAHKNLAAYSMTKAALVMLAKNLVIKVSAYNINVNAIAPGATLTERTAEDMAYQSTWSKITPMGRPAYPVNIA